MTQLVILEYPDARLRKKALTVATVDDDLRQLTDNMLCAMYDSNGIGLAATQVNVQKRVVVMDISETRDQPQVFINPEVVWSEDVKPVEEGCLSVPGIFDKVQRASKIRVRALGRSGEPFEMAAEGLLAVCIQHEIDHLDGKLFVDYLSELKRQLIRKRLEKDRKQRAAGSDSRSAARAL